MTLGTLVAHPALDRPDLLADATVRALALWPRASEVLVAAIDPDLADTAAFCSAYDVPLEASANCVILAGRRAGTETLAACVVLATTRADVNGFVRRHLDVRKISFAPMERAVQETGMEYGGITPLGLPQGWPILVDARVAEQPWVVIGSGIRGSKLMLPGAAVADLPGATPVADLAHPL